MKSSLRNRTALLAALSSCLVGSTLAQSKMEVPGTVFCTSGYVMDANTIDTGAIAENGAVAMERPYMYTTSSLVTAESSGVSLHLLEDDPNSYEYKPSWKISNGEKVVTIAESSGVTEGLQIEAIAVVLSHYPPTIQIIESQSLEAGSPLCTEFYKTDPPTPRPTMSPTTLTPTATPTSGVPTPTPTGTPTFPPTPEPTEEPTPSPTAEPTKAPTTKKPTPMPTEKPTQSPTMAPTTPVNCKEYQRSTSMDIPNLPMTFRSVVNTLDGITGTISAQVIYKGLGWIGFGISPRGTMAGSLAIVGIPDADPSTFTANPGKYFLGGQASTYISEMQAQTLTDSSIVQNGTHTIMTFTKSLREAGEVPINGNGTNTFIVAHGFDNVFAYHADRAVFQMELTPCLDAYRFDSFDDAEEEATPNPTRNPTRAPTAAPTPKPTPKPTTAPTAVKNEALPITAIEDNKSENGKDADPENAQGEATENGNEENQKPDNEKDEEKSEGEQNNNDNNKQENETVEVKSEGEQDQDKQNEKESNTDETSSVTDDGKEVEQLEATPVATDSLVETNNEKDTSGEGGIRGSNTGSGPNGSSGNEGTGLPATNDDVDNAQTLPNPDDVDFRPADAWAASQNKNPVGVQATPPLVASRATATTYILPILVCLSSWLVIG